MSGTVTSQGRVVGYSSYEVFLRQFLSENPGEDPPTEREWLASSITMGNSILMRIDPVDQPAESSKVVDIPLPTDSRICAANTIIGSLFNGSAHYPEGSNFATRVISYGSLIQNDADAAPIERVEAGSMIAKTGGADPVPYSAADISDRDRSQMEGYLAIVDGIVLQPGTWSDSGVEGGPAKEFKPDLTKSPTIRLRIRGPIANPVQVLLTGFTLRGIIQGETSDEVGSLTSDHPFDGDYLGPTVFPWANKIIFSVPAHFMSFMAQSSYTRKLFNRNEEGQAAAKKVSSPPIIDLADMSMYEPWLQDQLAYGDILVKYLKASQISTAADGLSILAAANETSDTVPALFAGTVSNQGEQAVMLPVDTIAPGTVKVFQNKHDSQAEQQKLKLQAISVSKIPGNLGMYFDHTTGTLSVALPDSSGEYALYPIIEVTVSPVTTSVRNYGGIFPVISGEGVSCLKLNTPAGSVYLPCIPSLLDVPNVSDAGIVDSTCIGGVLGATELLHILSGQKVVDLFGSRARDFLRRLPVLSGESVRLTTKIGDQECTGQLFIQNSAYGNNNNKVEPQMTTQLPLRTQANYIVVGGRRLYISDSAPTGEIPEGSLGIGW